MGKTHDDTMPKKGKGKKRGDDTDSEPETAPVETEEPAGLSRKEMRKLKKAGQNVTDEAEQPAPAAGKKKGNKKGKRRGDTSSDDEPEPVPEPEPEPRQQAGG